MILHTSVFRLSSDAVFKHGGAPLAVSRVNVLFNARVDDKLVAFALPHVGVWGEQQIVF